MDRNPSWQRASVQASILALQTAVITAYLAAASRRRGQHSGSQDPACDSAALAPSNWQRVLVRAATIVAVTACFGSCVAGLASTQRLQWPALVACCASWGTSFTLHLALLLRRPPQTQLLRCADALGLGVVATVVIPDFVYPAILSNSPGWDMAAVSVWQSVHYVCACLAGIILPLIMPAAPVPQPAWTAGKETSPSTSLRDTSSPIVRWWTYGWMSPFVTASYRRRAQGITAAELPSLDPACLPEAMLAAFRRACGASHSSAWALWVLFRTRLSGMALIMVLCGLSELLGSVGLRSLLLHLEGSPTVFRPFLSVLLFGLSPVVRGLFMQTFEYFSTQTICSLKSTVIYAVYSKLLRQRPGRPVDAARVVNHITADIDKIATLRYTIMACFMVPVEVVVASILIYRAIGYAYIPGLAVILVTRIPMSWFVDHYQGAAQARIMAAIDARVRRVGEIVQALQTVKMLGQTTAITRWIGETRHAELQSIWRKLVIVTISDAVSAVLILVPLVLSLGMYTLGAGGTPLTPSVAFTVAALFKTLKEMLSLAIVGVSTFAQAKTSLNRVVAFLDDADRFSDYSGDASISPVLENCTLQLVSGGLNIITGKTGSGKSTLLRALLMEQQMLSGRVRIRSQPNEAVSYAGQTPWLHRGTIRDNILFHSPYSEQRYLDVLHAVGLDVDFASTLPCRDATNVGEDGSTLSGGQRCRVAIARAVYAETKTVLLDNVLSALDATTARWIVQTCLLGPLLSGRTLVLVTENEACHANAHLIVELAHGEIVSTTTTMLAECTSGGITPTTPTALTALHSPVPGTAFSTDPVPVPVPPAAPPMERIMDGRSGRFLLLTLLRRYGSAAYNTALCAAILAMHASDVASSVSLALWSSSSSSSSSFSSSSSSYLGLVSALGMVQVVFLIISSVLFFRGSLAASKTEHAALLSSVLGATYAWTTATPVGQIMNRFSADMFSLDNTVTELLKQVVDNSLAILFRLAAVSSVLPSFFVPAVVLLGLGLWTGHVYTYGSTAAKQLYAASLSPLLSGVSEAIAGIEVIRAHRAQAAVTAEFRAELVQYLQMWQGVSACQRWLAVRMDALVGLISLSTATLALVGNDASPAAVGFSMTGATTLCTALLYTVYLSSLLEVDMSSFRRLEEYIHHVPQETSVLVEPGADVDYTRWPSRGELRLHKMSAAYALDADPVLVGIDLVASPGMRVAIVGRSGSGKSSLVAAVMRLIPRLAGDICIDNLDTECIDIENLRQAVCFLPQHPVLLEGSMRFNLDMSGQVPDHVLLSVLADVMGTGNERTDRSLWTLDKHIEARGTNLSQGERQLVTIARALVSSARLVIIDEATASLDTESEEHIQQVLRTRMADRTLIAIAHRLDTIVDFDMVLVMDAGHVVERGNPRALIHSGQGRFFELWQAKGTV